MAKIVLALVFSLLLVMAIRSEAQVDLSAPLAAQWGQAASSVKGAAETVAASTADKAGDATSSWSNWFNNRLKGLGIYHSDGDNDSNNAPAPAPK